MAAGYSWKLVRDGEEPQLAPLKQHLARQMSHSSTGSPLAAGDPARQGWGQGGLRTRSQEGPCMYICNVGMSESYPTPAAAMRLLDSAAAMLGR